MPESYEVSVPGDLVWTRGTIPGTDSTDDRWLRIWQIENDGSFHEVATWKEAILDDRLRSDWEQ